MLPSSLWMVLLGKRRMSFEEKLIAAHSELELKGVWSSNFNPPIVRLLRKAGLRVRPPYYQDFFTNLLFTSLLFNLGYGLISWFLTGQYVNKTSQQSVIEAIAGGLIFGVIISVFYLIRRKQLKLTDWNTLS